MLAAEDVQCEPFNICSLSRIGLVFSLVGFRGALVFLGMTHEGHDLRQCLIAVHILLECKSVSICMLQHAWPDVPGTEHCWEFLARQRVLSIGNDHCHAQMLLSTPAIKLSSTAITS